MEPELAPLDEATAIVVERDGGGLVGTGCAPPPPVTVAPQPDSMAARAAKAMKIEPERKVFTSLVSVAWPRARLEAGNHRSHLVRMADPSMGIPGMSRAAVPSSANAGKPY